MAAQLQGPILPTGNSYWGATKQEDPKWLKICSFGVFQK
jgi:hypothetical protein